MDPNSVYSEAWEQWDETHTHAEYDEYNEPDPEREGQDRYVEDDDFDNGYTASEFYAYITREG